VVIHQSDGDWVSLLILHFTRKVSSGKIPKRTECEIKLMDVEPGMGSEERTESVSFANTTFSSNFNPPKMKKPVGDINQFSFPSSAGTKLNCCFISKKIDVFSNRLL